MYVHVMHIFFLLKPEIIFTAYKYMLQFPFMFIIMWTTHNYILNNYVIHVLKIEIYFALALKEGKASG